MKLKNKKIMKIFIICTLSITISYCIYNKFYNINAIPEGKFINEIQSPKNDYNLKTYLIDGGSLSANAIRIELININTQEKKNIYFNYPEENVEMVWKSDYIVDINGIELNILKDYYDWRKNK